VRKLDGPSVVGILAFQGLAAVCTDSIYLLEPKTGKIARKFSWKDAGIRQVTTTSKSLVGTLAGNWTQEGKTELVAVGKARIQFSSVHNCWVSFARYAPESKLVYISHLNGLYVWRPDDGRLICDIRLSEKRPEGVGLVEVKAKVIYALTATGSVFALRHPRV
jgi:hypothetical protein